jgi:hypothetical protein
MGCETDQGNSSKLIGGSKGRWRIGVRAQNTRSAEARFDVSAPSACCRIVPPPALHIIARREESRARTADAVEDILRAILRASRCRAGVGPHYLHICRAVTHILDVGQSRQTESNRTRPVAFRVKSRSPARPCCRLSRPPPAPSLQMLARLMSPAGQAYRARRACAALPPGSGPEQKGVVRMSCFNPALSARANFSGARTAR